MVDREHKGLHEVTQHNGQKTRLITKHGFIAVFFLPEIKDMASFRREIIDNTAILREAAQRISALVGCWMVEWDLNESKLLIKWDGDLGKQFSEKEYPALEALKDHHHEEEDSSGEGESRNTIAERMLSRKRQCQHNSGDM